MALTLEEAIDILYIANQTQGPLDEVQRAVIAYEQRKPILMGGDPGSGKTELTKFLGKILGKRVDRVVGEPEK